MNGRKARALRNKSGYRVNNKEKNVQITTKENIKYDSITFKGKTQVFLEDCLKRDYKLLKKEVKK